VVARIVGAGATGALPSGYRPKMLEFRILGPLEVVGEEGSIRLGGPRQRATLALLLLNANRVVSVDRLADELYAGRAPVTAVTQVQRQISELRKVLGSASAIETRAPGYVIHLPPGRLDLQRFEQQAEEGRQALLRGDAEAAAALMRRALELWRGTPLADLADEPFARPAIARLEEIRRAALERRIEADLALGRHVELVGELEALVAEHPLQETLRGQLMLALYRSGRQAEALELYRRTRATLVERLGIEPTPGLRALERAILAHDPSLDPEPGAASSGRWAAPGRPVLVLAFGDEQLDGLLALAAPLARLPQRELILARLLRDERELAAAAHAVEARRASLGVPARAAAFTTDDPAADAARLAGIHDVELVLLSSPPGLDSTAVPDGLAGLLERSPADVAVLRGASVSLAPRARVFVPFGGGEHEWAALELAASLCLTSGATLLLVGTRADDHGRRDASRLLADASLAVQRVTGIDAQPLLSEQTEHALLAAVAPAALVVMGISPRWRREGIGSTRRALVRAARAPVVLVHGGPRPGGLAPDGRRTRFSWSISASSGYSQAVSSAAT
jgi:DNA-binding SARP family transcriptional activator